MVGLNAGNLGINVAHATGVMITDGNVISGNQIGVQIASSGVNGNMSDTTTVQGNLIGVAADGVTPLGNSSTGIDIFISSDNVIGGPDPGAGNVIAHNGGPGVRNNLSPRNRIEGNSIFDNGALGIDQNTVGVTLNDFQDLDETQNFPHHDRCPDRLRRHHLRRFREPAEHDLSPRIFWK